MTLVGEQNVFVRNIVNVIIKGSIMDLGTIFDGTLYVLINHGILYKVDVSNFFPVDLSCTFSLVNYKENDTCIIDEPEKQLPFLNKIFNLFNNINENQLVYDEPNCTDDDSFIKIINSKTADGAFRYYINTSVGKTFMYLYKGLFNMNKSDSCKLKVFNCAYNTFIANFTIRKSKLKINIDMYFIFLGMIGGRCNDKSIE